VVGGDAVGVGAAGGGAVTTEFVEGGGGGAAASFSAFVCAASLAIIAAVSVICFLAKSPKADPYLLVALTTISSSPALSNPLSKAVVTLSEILFRISDTSSSEKFLFPPPNNSEDA
jgi:hypothetical protein